MTTCRHCQRAIVPEDGGWIDPEATGDDSVWRECCDAHDTFIADHEPDTEPDTYEALVALMLDSWSDDPDFDPSFDREIAYRSVDSMLAEESGSHSAVRARLMGETP